MSVPLPAAEYYASLPRVIAGAGAVFYDSADRVLLVQPTYRDDTWEIPGGGMEEGEFPQEAARREIAEELGLGVRLGRLLVVDWVPPQPDGRPALVNFVFDGGTITPTQAAGLRLQDSELRAWRLCAAPGGRCPPGAAHGAPRTRRPSGPPLRPHRLPSPRLPSPRPRSPATWAIPG